MLCRDRLLCARAIALYHANTAVLEILLLGVSYNGIAFAKAMALIVHNALANARLLRHCKIDITPSLL